MKQDQAVRLKALVDNKQLWSDIGEVMDSSVTAMLSEAMRHDDKDESIALFLRAKAAQEFTFNFKSRILESALNPADTAGE